MRNFSNIAKLVKEKRKLVGLSQSVLSGILGYKNAQFISNMERGVCSVPLQKVKALIGALKCDEKEVLEAVVEDVRATFKMYTR